MALSSRERVLAEQVHCGIDEQLGGERDAVGVGELRAHRGQVAAGAVAADGEALGIAAVLLDLLRDELQRGVGVVDRGREPVLGREPVVDADDDRAGVVGEQPAHALVGVQVTDHETAAVEVDDRRCGVADPGGAIDACVRGAERERRHRLDLGQRRGIAEVDHQRAQAGAGLLRRALGDRGIAGLLDELQQAGDVRVQGHAVIQAGASPSTQSWS